MEDTLSYSQRVLSAELRRRQHRNANYSLRALARDLQLPRTTISEVIQGKRRLSKASVTRLQTRLSLESNEVDRLLEESRSAWFETKDLNTRRALEDEEFELVSSWYYYGILSLARLAENRADARWIAKTLGIEVVDAKAALKRLREQKLIEVQDGRMLRTSALIENKRGVPSRHVREQHRQFLNLAEQSLENVPMELRDLSTTTMPISTAKIPEARKMISKFHQKLASFLSEGEKTDSVYTVGIQLFPTRQHGAGK